MKGCGRVAKYGERMARNLGGPIKDCGGMTDFGIVKSDGNEAKTGAME